MKSVNSNAHLRPVFLVLVILSRKKGNDSFIYSNKHSLAFSNSFD